MMKTLRHIIIFCLSLPFFYGCADEIKVDTANPGKLVKISLKIQVPAYDVPGTQTKAGNEKTIAGQDFTVVYGKDVEQPKTKSSGTTPLYNLWVFQFDTAGNKILSQLLPDLPAPINDMVTIETSLAVGTNQTIYLVSLGNKITADLSGITKMSDLEGYTLPFFDIIDGKVVPKVTADNECPYAGYVKGLKITAIDNSGQGYIDYSASGAFSGAILLKSMLAKISFHFAYKATDFTPISVALKNVPEKFAISPSTLSSNSYKNMEATLISSIIQKDEAGRSVAEWYLPQNLGGTVSDITLENERWYTPPSGTTKGKAPATGTYIELIAQDNKSTNKYAYYSIFVGNNNTTNFDVNAHTDYTLRTDFTVATNGNDKRIIYRTTEFKLLECDDYGDAVTSTGSPTKKAFSRDGHPDVRPFMFSTVRGDIHIELVDSATNTLMDDKNSWLLLSTYPNYTDALNTHNLKTQYDYRAEIPMQLKFWLYTNEYIEDDCYSEYKSRTGIVNITSTPLGGGKPTIITMKVRQIPSQYIGSFGGQFNEETGEYSEGLCIETVEESMLTFYGDVGIRFMDFGFSGFQTSEVYKTNNLYSGKEATWNLVYNKSGFNVNNNRAAYFENPKFNADGSLMLYQYDTKKTYSARYCFDKNRDLNGNGKIDYLPDDPENNEYRWYLPSAYQLNSINLVNNMFESKPLIMTEAYWAVRWSSTTEVSANSIASTNLFYGYNYGVAFGGAQYGRNTGDSPKMPDSGANNSRMRCVKNVPKKVFPESSPQTLLVEDGYVVISTRGIPTICSVDRTKDADFCDKGVVKRHLVGGDPNYKMSRKFKISPTDVATDGSTDAAKIALGGTWAEFAGWHMNSNSLFPPPENEVVAATYTGCSQYKGKDGGDMAGTWRLPTQRELFWITILYPAMLKKAADTGFQPFNSSDYIRYLSCSEAKAQSNTKYYCYVLRPQRMLTELAFKDGSNSAPKNFRVRCIKDIP